LLLGKNGKQPTRSFSWVLIRDTLEADG
jgi:hypothetical protein